ncbi:hypothetical protein SH601_04950 [Gracilibacillus sp. S3-1-1]|uniref:Uncharacterized protein n=1 Tax=Gracilibacillus pellucidus TaxID=3095368 RepID=A0ACC6M358_9BACI|nr:hypothetical protein [Gracilibacillus sp. S3-1-1]MDX8045331.1 hypothetical protein [Gracilibacillus sp. S3-1-1]
MKVIQFPDLLNMRDRDVFNLRDMLQSSQYANILMMVTYAPEPGKNESAAYDFGVMMKNK